MKQYAALHCHSMYSKLDGASKVPAMFDRAVDLGIPAMAISDHGVLSGILPFYKEGQKRGVKPILGIEAYHADDRLLREKTDEGKNYYHLSLMAKDNTGYNNLLKVSTDSWLNGMYYRPRTDNAFLAEHAKGLIIGSGCLGGKVLQLLMNGDFDGALAAAAELRDLADEGSFFIELMNHHLPEQRQTNPQLIQIAKKLDVPFYASTDSHYVHKSDAHHHDGWLCCGTGSKIADTKRFKFSNDEYYIKSADEMYALFPDHPEALTNTLLIAEMCDVQIDFDTMHLPHFEVPEGFESDAAYLQHLTIEGLSEKFPSGIPEKYAERATYELGVMESMGVSSYFLIVWDLIKWGESQGYLSSPGRGSASGSLVSFAIGITKPDPIKHKLVFERFLNPSRVTMPDCDVDMMQRHREKYINYTVEKYGQDHTALIATFGTVKSRSAVRDAARVLGHDYSVGDRIAKQMPPLISGFETPLSACLKEDPQFESGYRMSQGLRDMYAADPTVKEVVDLALGVEGLLKSYGIHAAGTLIGDRPLEELVPLMVTKDGQVVSQWDKKMVESVGLLKMDYLGLKTLDVISDACKAAGITPDDIPLDDPETFCLLQSGHTVGCFQLESKGMRELLRRLSPDSIEDVSAVLALYRPGPMAQNWHNDYADRKNGRQEAIPFHEDAREILADTHQIMLYQEQIMFLSQKFAGYSMAEADNLRKIIGRKEKAAMRAERDKFTSGCVGEGHSQEFGDELFDTIDGFSAYGFNLSHSLSYSFISFWTAYLKTHHPREYMAALCSSVMGDFGKTATYLQEVRRMGFEVYPPSLEKSETYYTVVNGDGSEFDLGGVRVGLNLLRDIGADMAAKIVSERPYSGLRDFLERVNPSSPVVKSMAAAGALDAFGTRQGIISVADNLLGSIRKHGRKQTVGQDSLFAVLEEEQEAVTGVEIPDIEFGWHEKLDKEKKSLGLYVSGHPLSDYTDQSTGLQIFDLNEIEPQKKNERVLAMVASIDVKWTKKGDAMATLTLEDQTGVTECVAFPRTYAEFKDLLLVGSIVVAELKIGINNRDERQCVLQNVQRVESRVQQIDHSRKAGIFVPNGFAKDDKYLSKIKGLMLDHRGSVPVLIYVSRSATVELGAEYAVDPSAEFERDLKALFEEYRNDNH